MVKELGHAFEEFSLVKIDRPKNERVDDLSKWATASGVVDTQIVVLMTADTPSTDAPPRNQVVAFIKSSDDWMSTLVAYFSEGILPTDPLEIRRLQRKAPRYF